MANSDSIIRGMLNRGKVVREGIKEPWWSKSGGDILSGIAEIPNVMRQAQQFKLQQYSQEQATLKTFESRLNNPLNNAFADSTIYNSKTLDEIEATMSRMHSDDMKRFPKQQVDFTDIYESKLAQLNKYRSFNNQYNI